MTTAGLDANENLARNLELLQKQSFKVVFHLEHTDYSKVENIGAGAYGVVCAAVNKKTKQKVAIKKIPYMFTVDPRYAIRTYREIRILKHFKHDNIIAIREILRPKGTDLSDVYVVMDLMESDLHRIIYSKQNLTDEHIRYFLYQILRGLKYVHSANVIHRDLKPSNLLVNANCELKIGDFGMARGADFMASESNQQMTMYVATRWYRAPELILGHKAYGPSIDVWSVGCIFAEMLRRKSIFPGKNVPDQLNLIVNALGAPSKEYMDSLDSALIVGLLQPDAEPKPFSQICSKASPEALNLLSEMLVFEPKNRISVVKALNHPYLKLYHDLSDEHVCMKKFDFEFEQQLANLDKEDAKKKRLRELILKEVMDYEKPKQASVDFSSLFTTKPGTQKSSNDPYTELNSFLSKVTTQPKQTNPLLVQQTETKTNTPKPSENPLLMGTNKPSTGTNSLLAGVRNPLLAGVKNPLLANSTKPSTTANSLLSQADFNSVLARSNANSNPLLSSADHSKPTSLLSSIHKQSGDKPAATVNLLHSEYQSNVSTVVDQHIKKEQTKKESQNDTIFGSNSSGNSTPTQTDKLKVETHRKDIEDDIEMLSAKLEESKLVDKSEIKENKLSEIIEPMDTKALLRQLLIQQKLNKHAGVTKVQEEKKGVTTAYQRQKEREEKRKQKLQRIKKTKKKTEPPGDQKAPLLTSEDKRMLDRWKKMHPPQAIQPKPDQVQVVVTTISNTSSSGKTNNVIVVYPSLPASFSTRKMNEPTNTTVSTCTTNMITPSIQNTSVTVGQSNKIVGSQQAHTTQRIVSRPPASTQTLTDTLTEPQIHLQTQSQQNLQNEQHSHRTFSDIPPSSFSFGFPSFARQDSQEPSLYEPDLFHGQASTSYDNYGAQSKQEHSQYRLQVDTLNNWNTNTDINTLTRQLSKNQVEDYLPPTLSMTPKGTGGGYGVGYDFEALLQQTEMQSAHMDSAPLSASLLADWMDVTASMDPKDLEVQLELGSSLQADFPFNTY